MLLLFFKISIELCYFLPKFLCVKFCYMLSIGIIGIGHLGKIHLKCLQELNDIYQIVGIYDIDIPKAKAVAAANNVRAFDNLQDFIDAVEVIDIVTPTLTHFGIASEALRKHKHLFIEKPLTHTLEEARKLMTFEHEARVKVQVGHVERFNPTFRKALEYLNNPLFIETHRLSQFNPRGTDVSVVLDLMIHDIDIVLSTVKSNIKRISASGVAVVSETPDICNARIEFDNGCVANLTASRISLKNMRKSRFFQKDAYVSVDFLDKKLNVVRLNEVSENIDPLAMILELGEGKINKQIHIENPEVPSGNAIKDELQSLYNAIKNNSSPIVSLEDGYKSLQVAHQILEKIESLTEIGR